MNRENAQRESFDPTAPIGRADEPLPGSSPSADLPGEGEKGGKGDEELLRLIDQATRPPAGLRLDRSRLHAAIASESQPQPLPRTSQPANIRPTFWQVRLSRLIPLAAAAGLLLVASLMLLRQPNGITPIQTVQSPGSGETIVAVGLSPSEASRLVDNKPRDLIVVVPRLTDQPQPTANADDQGPLPDKPVLTDTAPLAGTAYGDEGGQASDLDNPDAVLMSYNR